MTFQRTSQKRLASAMNICEPIFDISTSDSFITGLLQQSDAENEIDGRVFTESFSGWSLPKISPSQEIGNLSKASNENLLRIKIFPDQLKLVPADEWKTRNEVCLRSLIESHFRARSTKRLRFEHKLWNALAITRHHPELMSVIGIAWETEEMIRVNRDVFGALLGLTRPTAALFNPHGSFQSHGFREVIPDEKKNVDVRVRFFVHAFGKFTQHSPPEDLLACKWQTGSPPETG